MESSSLAKYAETFNRSEHTKERCDHIRGDRQYEGRPGIPGLSSMQNPHSLIIFMLTTNCTNEKYHNGAHIQTSPYDVDIAVGGCIIKSKSDYADQHR